MQLPCRWNNKEGWDFHIKDKNIMRDRIAEFEDGKEINLLELAKMIFLRQWMDDDGEGNPPNYNWIKEVLEEIQYKVENGEFHPGLIERKIYLKIIFSVLTLFKQDSAYQERMGGWLTVTALDPSKWLECKDKEERIEYFNKLYKWWDKNDKRERTRNMIGSTIKLFINQYSSSPFVEEATNYFYQRFCEHRGEWQIVNFYDPKLWYPVGRGSIQNAILGGMG